MRMETRKFQRRLSLACLILGSGLLFLPGCGPSGPVTHEVSGTVTWNGQPIKQGSIIFVPLDKSLGAEGGEIKDGAYATIAKEGENRVEITALDIGPNTRYVNGAPLTSNFIPEHYNEQSELEVEVTSGNRKFDFDLPVK